MLILSIGSVATFLAIELIATSQLLEILYNKSKKNRGIKMVVWGLIFGLELVGFANP